MHFKKFNCRLCGGNSFSKRGENCVCDQCSVVFIDPISFTIPSIKCKFIGENAKLPEKNKELDSGYDLFSAERKVIFPGSTEMIKTNIAIELPMIFEAQIRARSGLAKKKGIQIANGPGTIDCGYRNQIGILLYNSSNENFVVEIGDRIAQLVPKPAPQLEIELVEELSETDRGLTGFGDSGVSGSIR
jgi:dUTP pyrophosphatase